VIKPSKLHQQRYSRFTATYKHVLPLTRSSVELLFQHFTCITITKVLTQNHH